MNTLSFKHLLLFVASAFILGSCKKTVEQPAEDLAQAIFEANILNKDFVVTKAIKNNVDITADYTNDTFVLQKNTYQDGPLKARKNISSYSGEWTCTEQYGKLTISLPESIETAEFDFLNRSWRFFDKKQFPLLKLSPWGTSDTTSTVLFMQRVD